MQIQSYMYYTNCILRPVSLRAQNIFNLQEVSICTFLLYMAISGVRHIHCRVNSVLVTHNFCKSILFGVCFRSLKCCLVESCMIDQLHQEELCPYIRICHVCWSSPPECRLSLLRFGVGLVTNEILFFAQSINKRPLLLSH